MDTKELREGFGSGAGRNAQISAYHSACCAAAREIDRLRVLLAECAPMVYANAEALHMLDGFHPQEREYDDLARRLRKELTPNVELTGAARLYRAASRERSERG